MTCGIYCIKNKTNKKVYVGSSINCEYRFKQHQKELRHDYHANGHLQKAIAKYGLENFEFTIIEPCPEKTLIENEDKWINKYNSMDSKFGYNKKSADRTIFSEETRQKIKDSHNTPEYKVWATKNANEEVWGNEEVKMRLLKNNLIAHTSNEYKEKQRLGSTETWNNNDKQKTNFSKQFKEKWDKEESPNRNKSFEEWRGSDRQKEVMSIKTQARWDDPVEREKMITARKEFGATEEFKTKISKIATERWANPEFKKEMSEQRKEMWKNPEYKKMMINSKHKNLGTEICKVCKKEFQKNIHNQTICSKECKYEDKNKKRKEKYLLNKIKK